MSDAQRSEADAINSNITTGITGVPRMVDEAPEVVRDKESDTEGGTDSLGYEVNVNDIERERTFMVETVDEE